MRTIPLASTGFALALAILLVSAVRHCMNPGRTSVSLSNDIVVRLPIDLGQIYLGESAGKTVCLRNPSTKPIQIEGQVSCGCTKLLLDSDILDGGSTANLDVRYYSNLRMHNIGLVEKSFQIFQKAAPHTSLLKVAGIVRVFVKPSLKFTHTDFVWPLVESHQSFDSKRFQVENRALYPIRLSVSQDKDDGPLQCCVLPSTITILPKERSDFTLQITAPLDYQPTPYLSKIRFSGLMTVQGQQKKLHFNFPVKVIPKPPVQPIPGLLSFSRQDIRNAVSKSLHFSCDPETRLHLKSLSVSSDLVVIKKLGQNTFDITMSSVPKSSIFRTTATFVFADADRELPVELPILYFHSSSSE